MRTRKMFVWMWIITGAICISVIAGGCAMPTSNGSTTPGPTQAPTDSASPIQPVASPSDLLPSPNSSESSGSYGLTPAVVGSKYGFIDNSGKLIINPQFDNAKPFSEGLARVQVDDKYGYIDKTGGIVIKPQFSEADNFSEGLAMVQVGKKYGYIDKTGSYVINPQFDGANAFSEGLAEAKADDLWGYIDKTGSFIIKPQFDSSSAFSEDLAFAKVVGSDKFGYIDKTGSFAINPQFVVSEGSYINSFHEGLAAVSIRGKYGYIDKTGSYVINPQFNYTWLFSEGLAMAMVGEKNGFIDKTGSFIINPQFDEAENFSEGLAAVKVGDKYGFIDKTGSYVINPQFDGANAFSESLAIVRVGDKWGYIDKTPGGHFVWNPDNIQLASQPSPQPSSSMPTIPEPTQASPGTQSKDAQVVAIANALVEAFNTTNPETLAQFAVPYYHDSVFGRIAVFMANNIANEGYKSHPLWKAGTVRLVGYYQEYMWLYVKISGISSGEQQVREYAMVIEEQNGKLFVRSFQ